MREYCRILGCSTRTVFRLERCVEAGHLCATVAEEPNEENVGRSGERFRFRVAAVTSDKFRIRIKSIANLDSETE